MCRPQYTEERRKAARAVHWWRAALELRQMRRGVARIPLWGNSSSGSTSEAAWGKKVKPGALVWGVSGVAGETEAGAVGGVVRQTGGDCGTPPWIYECRRF
ncbi:hypothetical protein NDU88_007245 [Pleurodeles waltl]|uniref:Uncharacterized protein n=1 Tax=Pleurodeles waltl TaxID=8319 RepID=A0AAV7UNA6_PLEWA|nr:hypothetical protein NDU88_007245 [Pleurodeles waltl]